MTKIKCIYCSNSLVDHQLNKVDEIFNIVAKNFLLLNKVTKIKGLRNYISSLENFIFHNICKFLSFLGLVKIANQYERSGVFNRTLVLIDEAEKNNIKIRPLINYRKQYLNHFHFKWNNKDYYFEGLPINLISKYIDFDLIDDKFKLKKFLIKNHLPTSEGDYFISRKSGLDYGLKLGFSLVVKPKDGSLSNHVSTQIQNIEELKKAINIVKEYTNFYIVEKFIPGQVHRITVIGQEIFAVKRLPPSVIGDGEKMLSELIEIKNQHPFRGESNKKDSTLHKIELDELSLQLIAKQGLKTESVPERGHKVYLKDKVNLNSGCDIIEVSDNIHPKNKDLFLKIVNLLNTNILGIDFICHDLGQPWTNQECGVIECNSLPYIDMHHFPSEGKSNNVAKTIVESIILNLK